MFNKVILAEDLDSISIGVVQVLEELGISHIQHSKYCDEAFLKIKKAQLEKEPFDLLITDLSFKTDHRESKLSSGEELIESIQKVQSSIKVIVFSIEDKSIRIKSLFDNLGIEAYILKGRNSIPELKTFIQKVFNNETRLISPELAHVFSDKTLHKLDAYDIELLQALATGFTLGEISNQFKKRNIIPNGTSSIEKILSKLKIYFNANNNVHLIAITKDLGLV